jgi:hypothetical protein
MSKHKHKEAPKKPTPKAAGAKAPVAPTPAVVADTDRKALDLRKPAPVTIVPDPPVQTIQPNPEPVVRVEPVKPAKAMKGLTPEEEILEVEKQIESLKARLFELQHPVIEFPKMVTPVHGPARTFANREEQDKAGPDYADKK